MAATERTTKQVVDDTRDHLRELVDAHVELAKAEVKQTQAEIVRGLVPLVVAGVLGLYLLSFWAVTAAKGIAVALPEWAAWLIVSGVVTLVVVVAGLVGARRLQRAQTSPETTRETVQGTVAWAKGQVGRGEA